MQLGYKYSSVVGLLLFGVCILVLGWFAQSKSFQALQIRGIEYRGVPDTNKGSGSHITEPIFVKEIKHPLGLDSLNISFEFMTQEPTFSYGNLFQTGDSLGAIRMELQPSNNLVLVLGDGKLFPLSKSIQIGKYYGVSLKFERGKFLKVYIDKTEVLNIEDKSILDGKFDISDIVVGTGLAKQRTLLGIVKNFDLNVAYSYYGKVARLARWALIFLCGIVFVTSLLNKVTAGVMSDGRSVLTVDLASNMALYGFSLAFVALALVSIHFLGDQHLGLSKWIVHLVLPISLIAALLVLRHKGNIWAWLQWPLGVIFLAYVIFFVASTRHKVQEYGAFILVMVAISLLAFGVSLTRTLLGSSLSQRDGRRGVAGIAIGISILFLVVSWDSVFDLTNWNDFMQAFDNHFGVAVVGAFLIMRAVLAVLFSQEKHAEIFDAGLCVQGKPRGTAYMLSLDLIVIAIFFWFSFRQDSLFIPGSEYHWEYYVGVVQGIRNGGWLLWDTPSQYGFLNVLLASLVPANSAWQAFYIFQGTLLFLVSTGIYFAARRYTAMSIFHRLAIFAIVFMALFFADPELIGPSPFPSSSVVRFLGVYALVLVAWFIPKFGLQQAIALSIVWSFSVIWSAESAIYGTAIILFILVALLQTRSTENYRVILAGKYVAISIMSLVTVFAVMFAFYFTRLGVLPDLFGFFEHAIGYAGGFGYVPFPLSGPGNLLLLVFMAISILCVGVLRQGDAAYDELVAPLAAMAGGIWGISTYYIGRPVPQNVTAMLPLIAMVVYFTLLLSKRLNQGAYSLPIRAVAFPLFFLVLIPLFNLKWVENLAQIQSFASDVTTKLPKANNELQQLLSRAKPSADMAIVYYGDEAAPPILSGDYARFNETNWLPIPLQLLEQPVSEVRRSLYLNRYICRNRPSGGILVNRKGDAIEVRLQGFLRELRQFYNVEEVIPGNAYMLYRFSGINLQHCLAEVGKKTSWQ